MQDYCNLHGKPGKYGGELEINAIAKLEKVNFIIH